MGLLHLGLALLSNLVAASPEAIRLFTARGEASQLELIVKQILQVRVSCTLLIVT